MYELVQQEEGGVQKVIDELVPRLQYECLFHFGHEEAEWKQLPSVEDPET